MAGDPSIELLVEAGIVLAGSLELDVTMREVAGLTVPRLADLCVIDMRADDGSIRGVAAVASDRELERGLVELRERFPLDPAGEHPVARVLRSGHSVLIADMTDTMLTAFARSPAHARFMIAHAYRSVVVAPLVARGRTFGALSVLRLGEREPFSEHERSLVDELARRAALAIDNARLFSELRLVEQRMEAILSGVAEAITVVDEDGRTVFANAAAAELLRVASPDELTSQSAASIVERFLLLDEEGRELGLAQLPARRWLRGEPAPAPLLVRHIVRETGEERWLIMRASPVADPATGRLSHIVNVFENVTELKRAELAERLLADASRILASSTPNAGALDQVAQLAIGWLADWCAIDLSDDSGSIKRVATRAAPSSTLARSAATSPATAAATLADADGIGSIIRAAQTHIWPADGGYGEPLNGQIELLRASGAEAVIIAPIVSGESACGAITLAASQPSRRFSRSDVALAQELGRQVGTAIANARRSTERSRIAHILQQALLPESLPESDALEVRAVYEAAGELNEVGGDFYDVLEYDDGRWLVVIGDVCGKGPHAAGMTALARHTLRAAAITGQRPARMLETLHQALLRRPQPLEPCTVCVVVVRPTDGRAELTVALAGHHQPLVTGDDGARPVGRAGTLLGAVDPIDIHETTAELRQGETLLLYTDGVIDAGRPDRPLGERGLAELCGAARGLPLAELLERIRAETVAHAGGALRDDVALLALRLRSGRADGR